MQNDLKMRHTRRVEILLGVRMQNDLEMRHTSRRGDSIGCANAKWPEGAAYSSSWRFYRVCECKMTWKCGILVVVEILLGVRMQIDLKMRHTSRCGDWNWTLMPFMTVSTVLTVLGDFPAKNTVHTPCIYVWFWPTLHICHIDLANPTDIDISPASQACGGTASHPSLVGTSTLGTWATLESRFVSAVNTKSVIIFITSRLSLRSQLSLRSVTVVQLQEVLMTEPYFNAWAACEVVPFRVKKWNKASSLCGSVRCY